MTRVALVGGLRTPFVRAGGVFAKHSFLDLGALVVKGLTDKLALDPKNIDELWFGTVLLDPRMPNSARELVFKAKLSPNLPAHFVSNNCISGLVAINAASEGIQSGRLTAALAGGSESMSRPALALKPSAEKFFMGLARAKSFGQKLHALKKFKFSHLFPIPPSPKEPSTGLTMGEHCELMAKAYGIGRASQDELALKSHQSAKRALDAGHLSQDIIALDGIAQDNLIRGDTSLEKLGKLPPVFDRSPTGTITAGNASSLTDGASCVCLMSENRAKAEGREVLAYLEGIEFAAIEPNDGLLMAPCIALPRLFKRLKLSESDVDIFEIHEAFAAQVLANLKIWESGWTKYGISGGIKIPEHKINQEGGSIALGHPFAATGARILISAARQLKRKNLKRAAISVCAAGAQACALTITRE